MQRAEFKAHTVAEGNSG